MLEEGREVQMVGEVWVHWRWENYCGRSCSISEAQHLSILVEGHLSQGPKKSEMPVSLVDCWRFLNRGNVMIKFVFQKGGFGGQVKDGQGVY